MRTLNSKGCAGPSATAKGDVALRSRLEGDVPIPYETSWLALKAGSD